MAPLRIGVIGARRNSQGIGEYVARDLASLGASVTAIVGTTPDTVDAARRNLHARYGLSVRGYCSIEAMLESEPLDAVAICSPHRFHRAHLQSALNFRLHTLCEKPLVFEEGRDLARDAQAITAAFAAEHRVLMVNEQWPYTLPYFKRCWPRGNTHGAAPKQLAMFLSPSERGLAMIPNALPHVLSLLFAVAPAGGDAQDIEIDNSADDRLDVEFRYVHAQGETRVAARFRQYLQQPRPAGYALDGFGVRRVISSPDYSMSLERRAFTRNEEFWRFVEHGANNGDGNRVALDDPLPRLLADFVHRIEYAGAEDRVCPTMVDNTRLLSEVVDAARSAFA